MAAPFGISASKSPIFADFLGVLISSVVLCNLTALSWTIQK